MPDTANLAQCIVEHEAHNARKVEAGAPVILLPGQPGCGPVFADAQELQWDDDDEPATVVKFSRAVQALRGKEVFFEPGAAVPPKQPEPAEALPEPAEPPHQREPTGEVPGLEEDVWKLGNPDWDIWMSTPDDEAPTHALSRQQALTGPVQPSLDPLPALGEQVPSGGTAQFCADSLGLEILEETTLRRTPAQRPEAVSDHHKLAIDEDVELVYLLKNKKKS